MRGNRTAGRDVAAMFAAYVGGDSLAKIGQREGISGERVRQLFRAAGYPPLPSAHTNRQRSQERRARLREPLIVAFRELHSVSASAKAVGCSVGLATDILLEAGEETGVNRAWVASRSKPRVTSEFCIEALRDAARQCGGRLSEKRYSALIRDGASIQGRAWPWPSTVLRQLGVSRWNEALERAGIPPCSQGSGPRGVPDEALLSLAGELQCNLGRPPTPSEYGTAAKERELPGVQSASRRFGSWIGFIESSVARR